MKDDPFDIRNLSEKVIGEEAQETQLIKWIQRGRACLLYGPTGTGKTTLAQNFVKHIKNKTSSDLSDIGIFYYSCDKDTLPAKIQNHKLTFFKWLKWRKRKAVVILDEIHFGDQKDIIRISALWDAKQIQSVVYIQINENPAIPQLVRRIGIHKMGMRTITRDEISELIRQRIGGKQVFEDAAILHIASNCRLNPSIALQQCAQVAEELADPEKVITLDQTKQFNFEGTVFDREIQKADSVTGDAIDLIDQIGPAHKKILRQLRITSSTIYDLELACEMKAKPIAARLGELRRKGMVEVKNNTRPKRFGLVTEFERTLLSDDA